ncbi:MAG TPA: hypothetical protein VIR01_17345 [Pyrinomonadaceae bacterium]
MDQQTNGAWLKNVRIIAAGTLVVWDVDVLREKVVRVYRSTDLDTPTVYGLSDIAEAHPALPGWEMRVDSIFS